MIILLNDYLKEKDENSVLTIKEQMIQLYQQLTSCPSISNEEFLNIIKNKIIFIDIDEIQNIRGTITIILERKVFRNGLSVAHIEDLVVDSLYRKQNIGKHLLQHVINYAKEKNCYKAILNCDKKLLSFYEKNNFLQKNIEMSIYL